MVAKETAAQIDELNLEASLKSTRTLEAMIEAKWLILLLVVASIVASLVISNMISPNYRASVTLTLSKSAEAALTSPATINQILDNDGFLSDVISNVKPRYTKDELKNRIYSEKPYGTTLTIYATDSNSRRAKMLADASARAFLARTKRLELTQSLSEQLKELKRTKKNDQENELLKLGDLDNEIAKLKGQVLDIGQIDFSATNKAVYLLGIQERLGHLEERKQNLLKELIDEGQTMIVTPAIRPRAPISPNIPRNVILSALSALIIGITFTVAFNSSGLGKTS